MDVSENLKTPKGIRPVAPGTRRSGSALRLALCVEGRLLRDALVELLGREEDVQVVAWADRPDKLAERCGPTAPDAVLTAFRPETDPRPARRAVAARFPGVPLVEATTGAGAGGGLVELLRAVRAVPRGRDRVAVLASGDAGPAESLSSLSDRELDVLRLVGAGLTAEQAGARLGVSARTVDGHKRRIFAKLGVQSQSQAVATALRTGLLSPTRAGGRKR